MTKINLMLGGKKIGELKPMVFERMVSEGYIDSVVKDSIGLFDLLWFIEFNKYKVRQHYIFSLLNPEE